MKSLLFSVLTTTIFLIISLKLCACDELLELTCVDAAQCSQYQQQDIHVSCMDYHCLCSTANGDRVKCRPKDMKMSNIIGGPCPCSLPQAECNTEHSICYCAKDFVSTDDRRRCIKKAVELGGACETDEQCSKSGDAYATCSATQKVCQCGEGYAEEHRACLAIVGADNATCINSTQCHNFGESTFCSTTSICLCPATQVSAANKTSCIEIADYEKDCIQNNQCLHNLGPGAVCEENVCRCDKNHFAYELENKDGLMKTACERLVVLGAYCRENEDCYQHHLTESEQTMQCFYGECNCKLGYNSINKAHCERSSAASLHAQINFVLLCYLALSAAY